MARIALVDAVRGAAVVAMIAYHFGFDLNYLGWLHQDINHDPLWLGARSLILGTFLFTAGASFALAEVSRVVLRTQFKRILKILGAALLVTAGSWLAFPKSAIYFGVLHALAVMSVLLLAIPRGFWPACSLGLLLIIVGTTYTSSLFDQPQLAWIGLMTRKPVTEDYVPLLPWFGTCLIGYGVACGSFSRPWFKTFAGIRPGPPLLTWIGRRSLVIYLVHQPLILAVLIPLTRALQP